MSSKVDVDVDMTDETQEAIAKLIFGRFADTKHELDSLMENYSYFRNDGKSFTDSIGNALCSQLVQESLGIYLDNIKD